jgi:predicted nucleic acid-binding protein
MALVLDTSVLVAALDADDAHHEPCAALFAGDEELVIPAPVLPELDYFCRRAGAPERLLDVLEDGQRGALRIEELRGTDYGRVVELSRAYADLRAGFVDTAVLAVVERLGEKKLATLDRRHFSAMRPRHVEALELVPA